MGLFDIFTKKSVSFEVAGKQLLSVAVGNTDYFLEEATPSIAIDLDIDLDTYNINILRTDTLIVCVWAAAKALEHEDKMLINIIYSQFFKVVDEDRRDQLEEVFKFRSEKYNNAWDESAGGNQQILATHILSDMFFSGELDERLFNIKATSSVIIFVFVIMESVLKARAKMRIIRTEN